MTIKNFIYAVAFMIGLACFDSPGGVFAVHNGFISLAGAIIFVQLLDKLDSWFMFLIGIAVITFLGDIVCGSRFIPFLCGYILPLAYVLVMLTSCHFSKRYHIPTQIMFSQLRKEILHGKG